MKKMASDAETAPPPDEGNDLLVQNLFRAAQLEEPDEEQGTVDAATLSLIQSLKDKVKELEEGNSKLKEQLKHASSAESVEKQETPRPASSAVYDPYTALSYKSRLRQLREFAEVLERGKVVLDTRQVGGGCAIFFFYARGICAMEPRIKNKLIIGLSSCRGPAL